MRKFLWITLIASALVAPYVCPVQSHEGDSHFIPQLANLPLPNINETQVPRYQKEQLGRLIFFDTELSDPPGQACASCHFVGTGFGEASSFLNEKIGGINPGAVPGRVGKRKAPRLTYASFKPLGPYYLPTDSGFQYFGGIMWDSRFRSTLDVGAMLDPNEMNNIATPSDRLRQGYSVRVARLIPTRPYAGLFRKVFHDTVFNGLADFQHPTAQANTEEQIFFDVMDALRVYIESSALNSFTSKYDAVVAGKAKFSASEQRGHDLFFGAAQCSNCHSSVGTPAGFGYPNPKNHELFSQFCLVNTGIPRNPDNPFYYETDSRSNPLGYNPAGKNFIDLGLADDQFLSSDDPPQVVFGVATNMSIRAPQILRNVGLAPRGFVKAFMHNGFFRGLPEVALKQVVHRYNKRNIAVSAAGQEVSVDFRVGIPPGYKLLLPPPENLDNLYNTSGLPPGQGDGSIAENGEIGNLSLSDRNEEDLVEFLMTLSDGFFKP